tara:strand:+ start:1419 stop:1856 length:438 start_codon:yes stop_codon:yes gene_type:complete
MSSKQKLRQPVLWYSMEPPKLSEDVPNIQPGDILQLTRKRRVRKLKGITLQKNGQWRSYADTFPKGTTMTYLGELKIENPHSKKPQLMPYAKVAIWGKEEETYFFVPSEIKSLKRFRNDLNVERGRKEVKDETHRPNGNQRSSDD